MKKILLFVLLAGCGVPAVPLAVDQRKADLDWVFAVFSRNYAPLHYKEQKTQLTFDQIKAECYAKNENITAQPENSVNDQFRALVYECVSKFQDAHTGATQMGTMTLGKAQVAYLGFKTMLTRVNDNGTKKEALLVGKILPTTSTKDFPIKENDVILSINGQSVLSVLQRELVPVHNLGQTDASLQIAAASFAVRSSMSDRLPSENEVNLVVKRNNDVFSITVPWVRKDYVDYMNDINVAKLKEEKAAQDKAKKERVTITDAYDALLNSGFDKDTDFLNIIDQFAEKLYTWKQWKKTFAPLNRNLQSFVFLNPNPALMAIESAEDKSKKEPERNLLSIQDISQGVYKAHLLRDLGGAELVGYIRIESFDLTDKDVKDFGELLKKMNDFSVKGVVIDLIDNGGGSLVHGMRMAALLSDKAILFPSLQVALNDNWFDSFRYESENASTDTEKEFARRIVRQLERDLAEGKRISSNISAKSLDVYGQAELTAKHHLRGGTPIVLLTNEMCASMCDIFSAMVKDNNLGKIVGSRTMGAGGNVVMHVASPSSHFMLRQTESLILDAHGNFIENNGVMPDIEMDTVADRASKFSKTLKKGMETILGRPVKEEETKKECPKDP